MTDGIKLMGAVERITAAYAEALKMPKIGVTGAQAAPLLRLGDQEMTVGNLRLSGCYIGTNASYNLKKLVDAGFLTCIKSRTDGRHYSVSLTVKGRALRDDVLLRHRQFVSDLDSIAPNEDALVRFAERLPLSA